MQTVTELKTEDVNALHASFTVVFITQQIVVVHPGSGSSVREWQLVLGKAQNDWNQLSEARSRQPVLSPQRQLMVLPLGSFVQLEEISVTFRSAHTKRTNVSTTTSSLNATPKARLESSLGHVLPPQGTV